MNDSNYYHRQHQVFTTLTEQDKKNVQEELKYLYMRLRQIGYNGDCAYEKKLAIYYNNAIIRCKEKLDLNLL